MAPGKKTLGGKNTPSRPPSVLPDPAAAMEIPDNARVIMYTKGEIKGCRLRASKEGSEGYGSLALHEDLCKGIHCNEPADCKRQKTKVLNQIRCLEELIRGTVAVLGSGRPSADL